jgi:hypothetical protein
MEESCEHEKFHFFSSSSSSYFSSTATFSCSLTLTTLTKVWWLFCSDTKNIFYTQKKWKQQFLEGEKYISEIFEILYCDKGKLCEFLLSWYFTLMAIHLCTFSIFVLVDTYESHVFNVRSSNSIQLSAENILLWLCGWC